MRYFAISLKKKVFLRSLALGMIGTFVFFAVQSFRSAVIYDTEKNNVAFDDVRGVRVTRHRDVTRARGR